MPIYNQADFDDENNTGIITNLNLNSIVVSSLSCTSTATMQGITNSTTPIQSSANIQTINNGVFVQAKNAATGHILSCADNNGTTAWVNPTTFNTNMNLSGVTTVNTISELLTPVTLVNAQLTTINYPVGTNITASTTGISSFSLNIASVPVVNYTTYSVSLLLDVASGNKIYCNSVAINGTTIAQTFSQAPTVPSTAVFVIQTILIVFTNTSTPRLLSSVTSYT